MTVEHDDELRTLNAFNDLRAKKLNREPLDKLTKRVRNLNNPSDRRLAIRELMRRVEAGEFKSQGVSRESVHVRIVESKVQVVIPDPPKKKRKRKHGKKDVPDLDLAAPEPEPAPKQSQKPYRDRPQSKKPIEDDKLRATPFESSKTEQTQGEIRRFYLRFNSDEKALSLVYERQRREWPKEARGAGSCAFRGCWPASYTRKSNAGKDEHRHTEAPWHGMNERSFLRELCR